MSSFSIQTFGCRVNQAESFAWADELQRLGLRYEPDFRRSDLILVNTCTVTRNADRDVRSFIRRIGRDNPRARLIVAGCWVERPRGELENPPGIERLVPNADKERFIRDLVGEPAGDTPEEIRPYRSRALVKIQEGCGLGCTFCIVPRVRGAMSSRPEDDVLRRVGECIERGFKEIVLTGTHICLYGMDLQPRTSFLELLQRLESVEGLERLRLSSLDPRFMDQPLLKHITGSEKICPHFHLSLQHGVDSVLRRMGRSISVERYARILAELRKRAPSASLGADIIAGFPEETDEESDALFGFLRDSPLSYLHVFGFSPRPGTPAAERPQVPVPEIKARTARLRELSREKRLAFRRRMVGSTHRAVVVRKTDSRIRALTANYVEVSLPSSSRGEGDLVTLRITAVQGPATQGREVEA